jgi:hypothetical protein
LAVDGSTVRRSSTPDVIAAFGPPPKGSPIPLGRLSVLYDVLNTVVVEADLVSTDVGERATQPPQRLGINPLRYLLSRRL